MVYKKIVLEVPRKKVLMGACNKVIWIVVNLIARMETEGDLIL